LTTGLGKQFGRKRLPKVCQQRILLVVEFAQAGQAGGAPLDMSGDGFARLGGQAPDGESKQVGRRRATAVPLGAGVAPHFDSLLPRLRRTASRDSTACDVGDSGGLFFPAVATVQGPASRPAVLAASSGLSASRSLSSSRSRPRTRDLAICTAPALMP